MKVYVLHSSNLSKRKKHILEQFRKHNIYNFEFIEKFDVLDIAEDESKMFAKDYKRTIMSLFLKHIYVYQLIAKDKSEETALIFEDDVILCEDFYDTLNKYIGEACNCKGACDANSKDDEYDMLFIGCGYNLHIDKEVLEDDKHIYKNPHTRATDSYVITCRCAQKICDYYDNLATAADSPITLPINLWLNKAILDKGLNVYWCEPTIVSQGSQSGLFEVSII